MSAAGDAASVVDDYRNVARKTLIATTSSAEAITQDAIARLAPLTIR